MTITELRDAIEKPARLPDVALTFDTGLVAEIIFALRERDKAIAGALPLLQFTLERLFAERDGTHLTWEAYNALGNPEQGISGVEGAIGTHCEDVFQQLPEDTQNKLGQVFLPLVSIDETTGEATRRRASLERVTSDDDTQTFVNLFIENRLLQTGRDNDDTVYVEITHEALFRSWERLVTWIETTRDDLRLLRQIEREASTWDKSYLLSAERLKPIHAAIERLSYPLSEHAHDFVYPQQMLLKELEDPATSEQRRMRIGDDLALLGDPREGVGVKNGLPDMLWLPVNGLEGTFGFEFGEFAVADFFIAKYLTTYEQYQVFVDAKDGYHNKQWWQGFPEKYQLRKLSEQRTKSPNNPRDSITWYQSVAFGRWMTVQFGGLELAHPSGNIMRVGDNAQIRIPTEWEWQWVAMNGHEKWQYPWGDWQAGHANTVESGLGRAIAVGMYPHGEAVCSALDISGNLYEWCANNKNESEIIDASNTSFKMLRGGAFDNSQNKARASYRNYYDPYHGAFNYYGCRLVVAPILRL